MNHDKELNSGDLEVKLQAITAQIRTLAHSHQGDTLSLLALLRALEHLHHEIREDLFQSSLPDNRQALYALLKRYRRVWRLALHRPDETAITHIQSSR
jgi:hypothetical protein